MKTKFVILIAVASFLSGMYITSAVAYSRLTTVNSQVGQSVKSRQIDNVQCDMVYNFMSSQLAEKQRAAHVTE